MPLDAQQTQQFLSWLESHCPTAHLCPACGSTGDYTQPGVIVPPLFDLTHNAKLHGHGAPMIFLACGNCGHVRLFSAAKVGLVQATPSSNSASADPEQQQAVSTTAEEPAVVKGRGKKGGKGPVDGLEPTSEPAELKPATAEGKRGKRKGAEGSAIVSTKWVLLKTIQLEPDNKLACFAMADLLEEGGWLDLAFCYRWMGWYDRHPGKREGKGLRKRFVWYREDAFGYPSEEWGRYHRLPMARLQPLVFQAMATANPQYQLYKTWHQAIADLAKGHAESRQSGGGVEYLRVATSAYRRNDQIDALEERLEAVLKKLDDLDKRVRTLESKARARRIGVGNGWSGLDVEKATREDGLSGWDRLNAQG